MSSNNAMHIYILKQCHINQWTPVLSIILVYKAILKVLKHCNYTTTCYLLSLVAQSASLVRTSRPCNTNNGRMLTILPTPNPLQEPHHV